MSLPLRLQAGHLAPLMAHGVNRLRETLVAALKSTLAKQEPDARTRFHEQFRKEVDDYDRDSHKKYHDDLNTTLIFVSRSQQAVPISADNELGWSILGCSVCLHCRRPNTDPAGL